MVRKFCAESLRGQHHIGPQLPKAVVASGSLHFVGPSDCLGLPAWQQEAVARFQNLQDVASVARDVEDMALRRRQAGTPKQLNFNIKSEVNQP